MSIGMSSFVELRKVPIGVHLFSVTCFSCSTTILRQARACLLIPSEAGWLATNIVDRTLQTKLGIACSALTYVCSPHQPRNPRYTNRCHPLHSLISPFLSAHYSAFLRSLFMLRILLLLFRTGDFFVLSQLIIYLMAGHGLGVTVRLSTPE